MAYPLQLLLTLLVEIPVAIWLAGRQDRRRVAVDFTLINLFSHPSAHLLLARGVGFWTLETIVVVTETIALRTVSGLGWRRSAVVSMVCNGLTIGLSLLLG